jgi:hypothetical protein
MYVVVRRYVGASKLIEDTLERQSDVTVVSAAHGRRRAQSINRRISASVCSTLSIS